MLEETPPLVRTLAPPSPVLSQKRTPAVPPQPIVRRPAKDLFDLVVALLLLILCGPIILLAALLVKLTSRGPAFYTQTRMGLNGQPFTIYKLRTMRHDCEKRTGACWSKPGDPRVTFLGRILRATHIDELPQLINVLRREMSLVGPRPERPEFLPELERHLPHYRHRLAVRPGITGLAQLQLPPDTCIQSVRLKLAYDCHYVKHVSLWLDLRIMLATATRAAGIPFRWTNPLFRLPSGPTIEH